MCKETHFSLSQFHRIRTYFFGRWSSCGRYLRTSSLGPGYRRMAFFQKLFQYEETRGATKPKGNTPTPKRRNTPTGMILNYSVWITLPQTQNLLTLAPCFTMKRSSKMILKGRSPMVRHGSRTHRLAPDWLLDGINLDPKKNQKSNTSIPKTNSQTC